MGRGKKKGHIPDSDEEPDDVMAWGNKRENYYQQNEDEYSQSAEEEQEAR